MAGSCEHDNETMDPIKGREFLTNNASVFKIF